MGNHEPRLQDLCKSVDVPRVLCLVPTLVSVNGGEMDGVFIMSWIVSWVSYDSSRMISL